MNKHTNNCMFACRLVLNEKLESFECPLRILLKTKGDCIPIPKKQSLVNYFSNMLLFICNILTHRLCILHNNNGEYRRRQFKKLNINIVKKDKLIKREKDKKKLIN